MQTTPPMRSAASIPALPDNPASTRNTEVRIRVIRVMPDTGLVPTVAIARAATVVNRNEMTMTTASAMKRESFVAPGCEDRTPKRKKSHAARAVARMPPMTSPRGRSRSVRVAATGATLRFRRRKSSVTPMANAFAMTRQERRMPMMPAAAMAPMPMWRT